MEDKIKRTFKMKKIKFKKIMLAIMRNEEMEKNGKCF